MPKEGIVKSKSKAIEFEEARLKNSKEVLIKVRAKRRIKRDVEMAKIFEKILNHPDRVNAMNLEIERQRHQFILLGRKPEP